MESDHFQNWNTCARSKELAKHISLAAAATISSLLTIFIGREKFMSSCLPTILDFLRHLALLNKLMKNINIGIHFNHCTGADNMIK